MGFFCAVDATALRMSKAYLHQFGFSSSNTVEKARVDEVNGIIRGVSVITSGVQARGHDLQVDTTTLSQMRECAAEMGTVPVKWNHKTGADAVAGYLQDFRIDDGKLLADWHLLRSHERFAQAIELVQRMPKNVGLSAAFMGDDEAKGGKKFARCSELVSVDLVANPAANPGGMFSAIFGGSVDSGSTGNGMDTTTQSQQTGETSLADVLAAINGLRGDVQKTNERMDAFEQGGADEGTLTVQEVLALSPEQLSEAVARGFITQADMDEVMAIHAEIDAEEGQQGGEQGQETGGEAGAGETAGAGAASGAAGSEFSALQKTVRELQSRFEGADREAREQETARYFETIEKNFGELVDANKELSAKVKALELENGALRRGNKHGARPLAFSAEATAAQGGKLHEFDALVKKHTDAGKSQAEAIRLAHKESPEAHTKWLEAQG